MEDRTENSDNNSQENELESSENSNNSEKSSCESDNDNSDNSSTESINERESEVNNTNCSFEKGITDSNGDLWMPVSLPDGQSYFYNDRTRETSWACPFKNYRGQMPCTDSIGTECNFNIIQDSTNIPSYPQPYLYPSNTSYSIPVDHSSSQEVVVHSAPIVNSKWIRHVLSNGQVYYSNSETMETSWELPPDSCLASNLISPEKPQQEVENDKRKPVTADPIAGTNWYVVLTGEGKHFYYDHQRRKSTFEKPEELEDNLILDGILEKYEERKKIMRANAIPQNQISLKEVVKAKLSHHHPYVRESEREADVLSLDEPSEHVNENECNKSPPSSSDIIENDFITGKKYTFGERLEIFNQLLSDKKVSAFSIYEHEISKLQEDPRFELLSAKERKIVFNEYLKTRVNKEREEKIMEISQKKESFIKFLKEVVKSSKMSYSDLSVKYHSNPRFRTIKKDKERESLFQNYIAELNNAAKTETSELFDNDNIVKNNFLKLLSEITFDAHTPWRRVKRIICDDERYINVNDSVKREKWFDEFIEKKVEDDKMKDQERMKFEREKASIKERERQVHQERKQIEETTNRQRGTCLHENAVIEFSSLLTDLINDHKICWNDAKRILKQDPRWKSINNLSRDDYLDLFDKHIDKLYSKLTDSFHKLIEEQNVKLNTKWEEIYPSICDDPRFAKFSSSKSRCKREFERYLSYKLAKAKDDLVNFLSEVRMIDNRFLAKARLIPSLYDELTDVLKKDNRYNVLDFIEDERKQIVDSYLEEAQKKGAPPPPTASTPSARFRKD